MQHYDCSSGENERVQKCEARVDLHVGPLGDEGPYGAIGLRLLQEEFQTDECNESET